MAILEPGVHMSDYTNGELKALVAPVLGVAAEDIKGMAIIIDLGDRFTLGGTPDTDAAKVILLNALLSGVLEA